jgi:hypothetical protein
MYIYIHQHARTGQRVNTAEAGYFRSLWWAQIISTHIRRLTDRNLERCMNELLELADVLKTTSTIPSDINTTTKREAAILEFSNSPEPQPETESEPKHPNTISPFQH